MAKVTEKTVRTAVLTANQTSKHLLVGLQYTQGSTYGVDVVARKTGNPVQTFVGLSASEAHEAITMFDLVARVTALQINGLAEALEQLVNAANAEMMLNECAAMEQATGALTKFRGRK